MAHQVPHQLPSQDDDDLAELSSPGLGKTPRTLSFINNVQSAVAQIEHRLATSPSAHPPPPSRQELPQTPPGPDDPVIDRVQFLESSLSIPSPRPSKQASLADSAFAGAINPNTSLVSSGAIISTTPPNTVSSNPCTEVDNYNTPLPEDHTSSASVSNTTDRGVNNPVSSIAPIVEQFETPVTPSFTKEQNPTIVAAPIAPIVEHFEDPSAHVDHTDETTTADVTAAPIASIVEHFETSSQPVEKTDTPQTIEIPDERDTTPVNEQSDVAVVDDKPVVSSVIGSGNASLEVKATTSEKNETPSDIGSETVAHGIQTESDIPTGVPAVSYLECDNAIDEASVETQSSTLEEAQSASAAAGEFTPVPIVDEVGHIAEDFEKEAGSDGVVHETDATNASCDKDQNSQSCGEETSVSEEDAESLERRIVSGELSEDTSPDTMQQETEADIGQTSPETADAIAPFVKSGEECESSPSLIGEKSNTPCELDNSVVIEPETGNSPLAVCLQTDNEADAQSTLVSTSNASCNEIESPTIPALHPSEDLESRRGGVASSESKLNSGEKTLGAAVGDTSLAEKEEQSEKTVGQPLNIMRTIEDDAHSTAATGTVNMDQSTVPEKETALRDVVEAVTEQEAPCQYKELRNLAETSGSPPENDESSDNGVGSISHEQANPSASPPGRTSVDPCTPQDNSAEVAPEPKTCDEDAQLEEATTGLQSGEHLSQESTASADSSDRTAVISKEDPTSPIHAEPFVQTSPKEHEGTSEREVMAAKAMLARDKLAKLSLGSPVKKPHRSPFTRKTGDARESSVKAAGIARVSPGIRGSPTGHSPKKSFSPPKPAASSNISPISAILEQTLNSPKQRKLRSPSASLRGTDAVLTGLPPRQSPIQKGRVQSPPQKRTTEYTGSENKEERNALPSEERSPLQLSQPSSDNIPRLPRVAGLASTRSRSLRTPHSMPQSRTKARIPRASTFSVTVPRSKATMSSPVLGQKGISSSPVTPTVPDKASSAPRPPLRRALSFTQSKPSSTSASPVSRALSSRSRGSDISSTLSLPASAPKPPRGARPRFTVPEPFALTGPDLQERSEQQMEEARRKLAEAETRPRVFKPRPMPDFSKPYPKPHK